MRAQQGTGTLHKAQPGGGTLQRKTDQPRKLKRKRAKETPPIWARP
nr:MAG TPA: hypothetical protein [Caudoviricetes sp.]